MIWKQTVMSTNIIVHVYHPQYNVAKFLIAFYNQFLLSSVTQIIRVRNIGKKLC